MFIEFLNNFWKKQEPAPTITGPFYDKVFEFLPEPSELIDGRYVAYQSRPAEYSFPDTDHTRTSFKQMGPNDSAFWTMAKVGTEQMVWLPDRPSGMVIAVHSIETSIGYVNVVVIRPLEPKSGWIATSIGDGGFALRRTADTTFPGAAWTSQI